MPLEREMLPDRPEAREKLLCAFRIAKAAHASLAFARRLVAVLCAVVQSSCGFDKYVLHVRQFRDLGFCRRVAAQLIVTILRGTGFERSTRLNKCLAAALSRLFCTRNSNLAPC